MGLRRRWLLAGLPLLVVAAAPANAETVDLALTCDTTLAPALRKVAAAYKERSGVHVFVFPTGPGLILPQLVREIQNDIVVTPRPRSSMRRCRPVSSPSRSALSGAIRW